LQSYCATVEAATADRVVVSSLTKIEMKRDDDTRGRKYPMFTVDVVFKSVTMKVALFLCRLPALVRVTLCFLRCCFAGCEANIQSYHSNVTQERPAASGPWQKLDHAEKR
jgi:hypothetical protein